MKGSEKKKEKKAGKQAIKGQKKNTHTHIDAFL